jgi:hypothetical protein
MSFLDNLGRKITEVSDRAKFEADKLQRTLRLESELGEVRRQLDTKRLEFGDRALELFKAGKIQSPTLAGILREIEALQASLTLKQEELRGAQSDTFVGPISSYDPPRSQDVPISVETPGSAQASAAPSSYAGAGGGKACSNCGFQTPGSSVFCPNCGNRLV